MSQYHFECDPDEGGCGHNILFSCLMSELDGKTPKSCPKCRKRKYLRQVFGDVPTFTQTTLGSYADKKTARMSSDQKEYMNIKHNEYKEKKGEFVSTDKGWVYEDR